VSTELLHYQMLIVVKLVKKMVFDILIIKLLDDRVINFFFLGLISIRPMKHSRIY